MGFIIKNSNHKPIPKGTASDPFTGGVADPFTGSGAYSTQPMDIDLDQDASEYFPQKTYLQFAQVPNTEALAKKLQQLNSVVPEPVQITEENILRAVSLFKEETLQPTDIPLLFKILRWPKNAENPAFNPVLYVVRLAFLNKSKNGLSSALLQSSETITNEFADIMIGYITDSNKPTNQ